MKCIITFIFIVQNFVIKSLKYNNNMGLPYLLELKGMNEPFDFRMKNN